MISQKYVRKQAMFAKPTKRRHGYKINRVRVDFFAQICRLISWNNSLTSWWIWDKVIFAFTKDHRQANLSKLAKTF